MPKTSLQTATGLPPRIERVVNRLVEELLDEFVSQKQPWPSDTAFARALHDYGIYVTDLTPNIIEARGHYDIDFNSTTSEISCNWEPYCTS